MSSSEEKYNLADKLFQKGDFKNLEILFAKTLPCTLNLKTWELYLSYVQTVNKESLIPAYEYALQHISFHYDIYDILVDYIALLTDVDKIREAYLLGLNTPIHNLSLLFKNYEQFENSLNKITAKPLIQEKMAIYQSSMQLYQRILPFLKKDDFMQIIKLESEERRLKVIDYYTEKYPFREEIYFIKADTQNEEDSRYTLKKGIEITNSTFLKCYYSYKYKDICILDLKNEVELKIFINVMAQKDQLDLAVAKCVELRSIKGLEYAAKLNYSNTKDINSTFLIFEKGFPTLKEKAFDFFISVCDISSLALFHQIDVNQDRKLKMANLLFDLGDLDQLKNCFDDFYIGFNEFLSIEQEKVFNGLPGLSKESVFLRLSAEDGIECLRRISLEDIV